MEQTQGFALQQALSPQMQQSLQLLQAPLMELRQLVATEMQANPVLEEDVRQEVPERGEEKPENAGGLEAEWNEYYVQRAAAESWTAEALERRQHFFDSQTREPTLQQHLLEQVGRTDLSVRQRGIALEVVGNIDDRGYLRMTDEEVAERAGCSVVEAARVVAMMQELDPPGVGARTLAECLLLQLRRAGREHSVESRIVRYHLEDLGRRKLPDIARHLRISLAEVQRAAEAIARLEPRPGRPFASGTEQTILPDVVVERDEEGYVVSLNDSELPALRIGDAYKDMLSQPSATREVRDYLREKIRGGRFFMKCIEQRQHTLLNIAREIVGRQTAFFDDGPAHLRPMTMSQVADAVRVHETTVSRAVAGKYMTTPRGLFELKYFFTVGYTTSEGEAVSNESVRVAIAELVRGEPPRKPLSDQDIVARLAEQGLPIARRTVAKYREQLGILPSHLRKSF